jgi:nucleoside-diphosphate-sugar epimerase
MQLVFVTGSSGMLGDALVKSYRSANRKVYASSAELFSRDLEDELSAAKPRTIVHLAGLSFPPQCESDKDLASKINVEGTARVCEMALKLKSVPKMVLASSAQIYSLKAFESGTPVSELSELGPQNHYALTKLQAEKVIDDYFQKSNQTSVVLRLFNHTHKSQDRRFFLPSIYKALSESKSTGATEANVSVGNLNLERDIGALQDLVSAVVKAVDWAEMASPCVETANICSGRARNLKTLALLLASHMGVRATFNLDPSRLRADEALRIVGDCSKAKRLFDWKPRAQSDEELIKLFLD